jgi:hypothetical protein
MGNIFLPPRVRTNQYGKMQSITKPITDFNYLLGQNINDIILFDNGTDELLNQGRIILPRHYTIFVGNKEGELQLKPYEFDQYRIVVSTIKDIIISVDSIG